MICSHNGAAPADEPFHAAALAHMLRLGMSLNPEHGANRAFPVTEEALRSQFRGGLLKVSRLRAGSLVPKDLCQIEDIHIDFRHLVIRPRLLAEFVGGQWRRSSAAEVRLPAELFDEGAFTNFVPGGAIVANSPQLETEVYLASPAAARSSPSLNILARLEPPAGA